MDEELIGLNLSQEHTALIQVDHALVSVEALLKTCYWFSRDFVCDVTHESATRSTVRLTPKPSCEVPQAETQDLFMMHALDFALRERVTARTSEIRDLLLAKAFSESGVLEEQPLGIFGDAVEEAKPDGMFKILSNK